LFEYYEKWYNPVVRELAVVVDWKEDYQKLSRCVNPPIKASEARESIVLLLNLGFLKKNSDGTYEQTSPDITTGPEVNSLAIRALNREYARLGMESIDRFPPSMRDVSSVIMAVPRERLADFKREIVDFRKKIITMASEATVKSDSFYSLVVEFFPIGQQSSNIEDKHETTD
jgi:uncharacterized protein (TIGR02147 family)